MGFFSKKPKSASSSSTHSFRRHPSQIKNKAVKAAFKVGVKTGMNKQKRKGF